MPQRIALSSLARVTTFGALAAGVLAAGGLLSACSSAEKVLENNPLTANNPFTVFVDPGMYIYYTCEQLAGQRATWKVKEQDLKLLMDKARQSTGGAVVNVIAYQQEYATATEQLKVIDMTARNKNCPQK